MRRWWAWLLTVALTLLLAPGTAVAQQDSTPPSIVSFSGAPSNDGSTYILVIRFTEPLSTSFAHLSFRVTFGDTVQTGLFILGTLDPPEVAIQVTGRLPAPGQTVIVSYSQTAQTPAGTLKDAAGNLVEDFRWRVGVGQIATVAEVYAALKLYFSGSVTLSEVEDVLSGDDQTYHEKLSEEAAAGRLHERLPAGEGTNWSGEDEDTEGWVQIGSPSRLPDSSDTCGGETAPELTGGDQGNFYWACSDENTSNGRWVPVRIPRPGVDYAWDYQLLRPGDPDYNEECLYVRRDEDGNPVLDENGDRIPRRVSSYDPATDTFTYNDGNSWDPIAEQCTTRGNPGSGPVFRQ